MFSNNNNNNNNNNNYNNNNNNNDNNYKSWTVVLTSHTQTAVWAWDVPLFADTTQVKGIRIDAKVIDKTSKQVRVIKMGCPWLENRGSKDFEKTTKYSQLRLELTNRYPEYKVNQYNIIMDVKGAVRDRLSEI